LRQGSGSGNIVACHTAITASTTKQPAFAKKALWRISALDRYGYWPKAETKAAAAAAL
jgi:hypothetical protein